MVTRISGLSSGLDTDTLIKEMMTARRAPVNKLNQKKQLVEWQREDYRSINSKLLDYRNTKLFEFKRETTFSAKSVSTSGASNVVTVAATSSSVDGNMNIEVSQLATATTKITTAVWDVTKKSTESLTTGIPALNPDASNQFKIKVNTKEFTFNASDSLDKVISTVNSDSTANATLYFDSSTGRISATSKVMGSTGDVAITDVSGDLAANLFQWSPHITKAAWSTAASSDTLNTGLTVLTGGSGNNYTINVNGKNYTFDATVDTLDTVKNTINADGIVNLTYDPATKQISATSTTGDDVSITDVTGNLASSLFAWSIDPKKGQDALVKINGINTVQTSNTFKVNGTDVTLNGLSPSSGGIYTPTTVVVKGNVDKMMDSIKTFLTDYNELLKTLNDKVGENRYRSYDPLTSEQKEAMKDKEIELWENRAKSGLLKNDAILTKVVSEMRTAIISSVNTGSTKYKTLSSIGIETGTYQENGRLYLKDEAKLREALEKEPEAVKALFTSDNDGTGRKGVAETLYDSVYTAISSISSKAGTSKYSSSETFSLNKDSLMGKQLSSLDRQIDSWNDRLIDIEDRYYKQFAAMEAAMTKYNSQSSYLANALSGG